MAIGVLFGCFGREIDGPSLSGELLIYQGHLFPQKDTYDHGLNHLRPGRGSAATRRAKASAAETARETAALVERQAGRAGMLGKKSTRSGGPP